MRTTTAQKLIAGQTFTDPLGSTHTALSVDRTAGGTHAGIYVEVEGQGHPEFYLSTQVLTLVETKWGEYARAQLGRFRKELAQAKYYNRLGEEIDTLVIYDVIDPDTGRETRRKYSYKTTGGLLKGLIRMYSEPYKFQVVDVL